MDVDLALDVVGEPDSVMYDECIVILSCLFLIITIVK